MLKKQNNIEELYIKKVRMLLPRTKKNKAYLKSLQTDLMAYLCKNPDSTMEDIYDTYGTPAEIVQFYLSNQSEEDLKQLLSQKKWKHIIYTCAIVVPIAMGIVFSVNVWYWQDIKMHIVRKIETNTDESASYKLGDVKLWGIIPIIP